VSVSQVPDSFEFADYLGVLRRRWLVVALFTCLGLAAAGAYVAVAHKAYTATASVNVTATGSAGNQNGAVAGGRTSSLVNLDTEAQIVQSSAVAASAARALHATDTPAAVAARVSVAVPANSSVLEISCQAATPQKAAACANAFATAYLQNRTASAAAATKAQLRTVRDQLNSLQRRVAQLTTQISVLPLNSPQRAAAQAQLQTASSQLRVLASQAAALSAQSGGSSGGSILTKASPPASPSKPKKLIAFPGGLLAGLLAGLIVAFALDRRKRRISSSRDADRLGLPVLLSLTRNEFSQGPLVPARSPAGLEFTELARVTGASLGDGNHLLLVAGASPGTSASVVSVNLAATLARTRSGVIFVCAAASAAPELLGLDRAPALDSLGVADLAMGKSRLDQLAVQLAGSAGLRVLILDAELSELRHEHVRELAGLLRASAEYVVIDAPPRQVGADTFALAEFSDAALLTVEIGTTTGPDVDDCVRRLTRLRVRILGSAAVPRAPLRAARRSGDGARLPIGAGVGQPSIRPAASGEPAAAASDHARPGPATAARNRDDPALSAQSRTQVTDRSHGN
jgi:capsular polysaccharide biosynthesis protein